MAALRIGRHEPIVFSHLVGIPPFSMLGMIGAKLSGATCALLLHDFYPHQLRFPGPLQPLERFLYRWSYRSFDLVVALTPAQVPRLRSIGIQPDAISFLPMGVFTLRDVRTPSATLPLTLLVFGSLRRNKRIKETIRAVQNLRSQDIDVRLLIAGSPSREEAAYWAGCLEDIEADKQGIEVLARFIEEDELPELLSRAHAFICPYRNFDSQSAVALLALSNGVPLIATAAVGVPAEMSTACEMIEAGAEVEDIEEGIRGFYRQGVAQMQARASDARDELLRERSWITVAETLSAQLVRSGFFARDTRTGDAPRETT